MLSMVDFQQARTRERIASHPLERQRATAMFILQTSRLALDLKSLANAIDCGLGQYSGNAKEAMDYIETQIRKCYREAFGAELGSIKLDGE